MVSLRFREFLTGYMAEEFDSLVAQLRSFFSISFNEDGTLQGLDLGLTSVPIGSVVPYAGATAPDGWLLCDGNAVSRITYKSLFEVVSTTYGAGDGSTTFNLPDLRQRFPLGKAASGTGASLGATGGNIDHTHGSGSHTHTIDVEPDHMHAVEDHAHDINTEAIANTSADSNSVLVDANIDGTTIWAARGGGSGGHIHQVPAHDHGGTTANQNPNTEDAGEHDHGGVTGSSAGTTDAENPPYISLNFIILAAA